MSDATSPREPDLTEIDIPIPTIGQIDQTVLVTQMGQEAFLRTTLESHVKALTETIEQKDQQIAALRAKLIAQPDPGESVDIPKRGKVA